jgi:hypothetical protein
MGPATPELYSAKASKVQRLRIGFRRSSRFAHAFAEAAQMAVVQVQARVPRDLFRGYLRQQGLNKLGGPAEDGPF